MYRVVADRMGDTARMEDVTVRCHAKWRGIHGELLTREGFKGMYDYSHSRGLKHRFLRKALVRLDEVFEPHETFAKESSALDLRHLRAIKVVHEAHLICDIDGYLGKPIRKEPNERKQEENEQGHDSRNRPN